MKSFDDIFHTLQEDYKPQSRTLIDLGILLSKAYFVLGNEKFQEYIKLEMNDSVLHANNPLIEGLIQELSDVNCEYSGSFIVKSEGIERFIKDIKSLELESGKPVIEESFYKSFNFAELKAQLLYLVYTSREGLIRLKQKQIMDHVAQLNQKEERLEYLDSLVHKMKTNVNQYDEVQFTTLVKFIDCELTKWKRVVENSLDIKGFNSTEELHDFLVAMVRDQLEYQIRFTKGFKHFWKKKDQMMIQKKENQFYPYIKSILEPACQLRDIHICHENIVSNGRIDLTFSHRELKVCMEIKKAHYKDTLEAINHHFTEYLYNQATDHGIYLILWYQSEEYKQPRNYHSLDEMKADFDIENNNYQYQIMGIDCSKPHCPEVDIEVNKSHLEHEEV